MERNKSGYYGWNLFVDLGRFIPNLMEPLHYFVDFVEFNGTTEQYFVDLDRFKHCQRHNGPRILSPKVELSQKAETNANSNLAL